MLPKGMTLKIARLSENLITTSAGASYTLGPMPNDHEGHPNPKTNDILVVENPQPHGQALVTVYDGCGCRFLIYPESN